MMYPDVFVGGYGPEAFMAWADSLDSFIAQNQVSSRESLSLAVSLLRGESRAWWRVEEEARWSDEEPIYTWNELKIIMCSKYVPGFQWEEEESDSSFNLEEIGQPDSLPEDSLPMIASEQDGGTQVLCMHVPDQTKQQEKVLGESSTQPELAHALIDQRESFQSLSCGLLTWFTLEFQPSLVEYLRVVKVLQQYVFEPGGSLSVSRRSNNNLVQKTVSYKLDWQGSFTPGEQDLRSNLFEGREDGMILSSCCDKRGETGVYTFLIRSITDQNKLRRARLELFVVKEKPKLESEYGDQCTHPPGNIEYDGRVVTSCAHGDLRDLKGILLSSHKGLVRPPDQPARFLLVFEDLILLYYQGKNRTHAEVAMVEACVWSKWREAPSAGPESELNKEQNLVTLSSVCNEIILRNLSGLQHFVFKPGEEVCVCENRDQVVFNRARSLELIDQGSIILQDLDLRTNPFEGREHGAILNMLKLKRSNPAYGLAKILIKAWLNGKFQGLTGMIYEVLDREKRRTLGTALKQLEQGRFISAEINMSYGGSKAHYETLQDQVKSWPRGNQRRTSLLVYLF